MLEVKLGSGRNTPLHEQVATAIRRAIDNGEAVPGERLPPAKDLAAVLGVNANTVLRALRALRDEGLLEFRRGRGVMVAADVSSGELTTRTRELLDLARLHGYTPADIIQLISKIA